MGNKAMFLDRDQTLIEDPGYISDPSAVKLLPGVELAVKSLSQAGYKIVVVTNQAGIAKGLLTEEMLELIHAEMRRQLADRGAHLDGIYYCPYHPEGTVEKYAMDSDFRKPKPGMLLQAGEEMDIDLTDSWMVGDSPRDIEAGQRAGCRTVRVRTPGASASGDRSDEDVQADFTVRNLVDAARVILRESARGSADERVAGATLSRPSPVAASVDELRPGADTAAMSEHEIQVEILRHVRQIARESGREDFSGTKAAAGVLQALAIGVLLLSLFAVMFDSAQQATLAAVIAGVLQLMALTFFIMHRSK